VGTIVSKYLVNNFSEYLDLISGLGVAAWELYRPMDRNAILDKNNFYHIEKSDVISLYNKISKIKRPPLRIAIANPVPFCILKGPEKYTICGGGRYDDGHSRLVYDASGFFKPSYSIRMRMGESIRSAWHNTFLVKMHALEFLPGKCKACQDLKWCYGGSRFWAHACYGSFFDKDPWMR
jgi:MoaA/NifB/PqqE/SkfB family radical SAM enzyme